MDQRRSPPTLLSKNEQADMETMTWTPPARTLRLRVDTQRCVTVRLATCAVHRAMLCSVWCALGCPAASFAIMCAQRCSSEHG